jgi:hypothetical protein
VLRFLRLRISCASENACFHWGNAHLGSVRSCHMSLSNQVVPYRCWEHLAFSRLQLVVFPCQNSLESIPPSCFANSQCGTILFDQDSRVQTFEVGAFIGCTIRFLRVPRSVERFEKWCFAHCNSLDEITFENGSKLREIKESCPNRTRAPRENH